MYFLDKTVVTQITRDSMKALEEALVGTTDKEADKKLIKKLIRYQFTLVN